MSAKKPAVLKRLKKKVSRKLVPRKPARKLTPRKIEIVFEKRLRALELSSFKLNDVLEKLVFRVVVEKKSIPTKQVTEVNQLFRNFYSICKTFYTELRPYESVLGKDRIHSFMHELYHALYGPYVNQETIKHWQPNTNLFKLNNYEEFMKQVQNYKK